MSISEKLFLHPYSFMFFLENSVKLLTVNLFSQTMYIKWDVFDHSIFNLLCFVFCVIKREKVMNVFVTAIYFQNELEI